MNKHLHASTLNLNFFGVLCWLCLCDVNAHKGFSPKAPSILHEEASLAFTWKQYTLDPISSSPPQHISLKKIKGWKGLVNYIHRSAHLCRQDLTSLDKSFWQEFLKLGQQREASFKEAGLLEHLWETLYYCARERRSLKIRSSQPLTSSHTSMWRPFLIHFFDNVLPYPHHYDAVCYLSELLQGLKPRPYRCIPKALKSIKSPRGFRRK